MKLLLPSVITMMGSFRRKGMEQLVFISAFIGTIVAVSLLFVVSCGTGDAEARTITVDETGGGDYRDLDDAIYQASEGDTIHVRAGNYSGEEIMGYFPDNLTIKGDDRNTTRIEITRSYVWIWIRSNNLNISGLNFSAASASDTQIMAHKGSGINFRNCTFYHIETFRLSYDAWNCTIENNMFIMSHFFFNAKSPLNMSSHSIINNTFNGEPLLYLTGESNLQLSGTFGGLILVNCSNININDWDDTNESNGIILLFSNNITIETCSIRSRGYIIDVGTCQDIRVSNSSIKSGDSSSYIYSWYSSRIEILNNSLLCGILILAGDDHVIHDNEIIGVNGMLLMASLHASIVGNTMENMGIRFSSQSSSNLNVTNYHHVIRDNTIGGRPILYYLGDSSLVVPADAGQVIMVNCTKMTMSDQNFSLASTGVFILNSTSSLIEGCEFSSMGTGNGIEMILSRDIIIESCSFIDTRRGISADNCTGVTIRQSYFQNASISLYIGRNNTIENCNVIGDSTDPPYRGIASNEDITILNTEVSWFTTGISLSGENSHVEGCTVTNNTIGIYVTKNHTTIINCIIANNLEFGIEADEENDIQVDARYNYWGAVNGPLHLKENPAGWGDRVSDGVTFSPWHTSRDFVPHSGSESGGSGDGMAKSILIFLVVILVILLGILLLTVTLPKERLSRPKQ